MAITTHGYWVPGTPYAHTAGSVIVTTRCGGIGVCSECSNAASHAKISTTCDQHEPRQHRDARPAWCTHCGLTADMKPPYSRFKLAKQDHETAIKEKPLDPSIPVPEEVLVPAQTDEPYMDKARRLVTAHANKRMHSSDDFELKVEQTYVVWFVKALQNWKALVSTQIPDQMYYEVTYDGDKEQAYVDSYKKWENSVYPDVKE